jgi:hypothetical protein
MVAYQSSAIFTAPAGFTLMRHATRNQVALDAYRRIAGGSEPSSYSVSWDITTRALWLFLTAQNVGSIFGSGLQAGTGNSLTTNPPAGSAPAGSIAICGFASLHSGGLSASDGTFLGSEIYGGGNGSILFEFVPVSGTLSALSATGGGGSADWATVEAVFSPTVGQTIGVINAKGFQGPNFASFGSL